MKPRRALDERDYEILSYLDHDGYRGDRTAGGWFTTQDCGGCSHSNHSARLMRLMRLGLVISRQRGRSGLSLEPIKGKGSREWHITHKGREAWNLRPENWMNGELRGAK